MTRLYAWLACSALCFAMLGCSDTLSAKVTGTVTMDNAPLSDARVTFTPQGGGRTSMGTTNEQGEYTLYTLADEGVNPGSYKVVITTEQDVDQGGDDAGADDAGYEEQAMNSGNYDEAGPPEEPIPAKYNTESELTAEVKSGSNVHDFALTST